MFSQFFNKTTALQLPHRLSLIKSLFVKGKGAHNAICTLRTLTQRSTETQKKLCLCFIDYSKAFDNVKHKEVITILRNINSQEKDLRKIKMFTGRFIVTVVYPELKFTDRI